LTGPFRVTWALWLVLAWAASATAYPLMIVQRDNAICCIIIRGRKFCKEGLCGHSHLLRTLYELVLTDKVTLRPLDGGDGVFESFYAQPLIDGKGWRYLRTRGTWKDAATDLVTVTPEGVRVEPSHVWRFPAELSFMEPLSADGRRRAGLEPGEGDQPSFLVLYGEDGKEVRRLRTSSRRVRVLIDGTGERFAAVDQSPDGDFILRMAGREGAEEALPLPFVRPVAIESDAAFKRFLVGTGEKWEDRVLHVVARGAPPISFPGVNGIFARDGRSIFVLRADGDSMRVGRVSLPDGTWSEIGRIRARILAEDGMFEAPEIDTLLLFDELTSVLFVQPLKGGAARRVKLPKDVTRFVYVPSFAN
jgi:hypothetical protein